MLLNVDFTKYNQTYTKTKTTIANHTKNKLVLVFNIMFSSRKLWEKT